MKKTTISSLIGLLLSTPAFAATTMINADDVVVTASRVHENIQNVAANLQVITREQISELNSSSIPQILSQIGGLNISGVALGQFNRGAIVDIGGYGATGGSTTLVLINGQRISPIDSAAVPWEIIPIGSIDRIEILKGGAGVQYGDRAVGGVINIVTNESQNAINQASVTFGSFGTKAASAVFQNKYNDTLFKVSGSANHSDGWRQNTESDQYSLDARVTQYFDKNSVYLEVFGNHNKNETPGAVIAPVGNGNPRTVKCDIYSCFVGSYNKYDNYGVGFGAVFDFKNHIKFEGDFSYKNTKSEFFKNGDNQGDPLNGYALYNPPQYFPYNANYSRWRMDFSPRLKIDLEKLGDLIVGYDYGRSSGSQDDQGVMNDYTSITKSSASLTNNSIYLSHRFAIKENLDLLAGFRREAQSVSAKDDDGNELSNAHKTTSANAWELALNYKFSESQKIYAKYSQAFRFPNIDEFWGYEGYTRTFVGGIINPQIDRTAEIGSSFVLINTQFTTSIFHTRTEDEIRYQVATGKNINDANLIERKGVYLSTNSSISDKLSLYTNSKFQDASYINGPYDGKSHDLVPNFLINARLNYKFDNELSFGLVSNYVGSQYYDGANDKSAYKKMPSYLVTDLYASKKINQWDLRLTVRNIANENYSTYGGYQDKGASFYKGYYYYPSDPRSLFATLSYNF